MKYLDPKLGKKINYDAYGHDCKIYDPEKFPNDPFHNFWLKIDGFVVAHYIGWIFKTLMMRDFWLANVVSALFELCEYSLEHQLKNFSECWWDHWIMDFLICNLGGIVTGMYIIKWLKNKNYDWRGLRGFGDCVWDCFSILDTKIQIGNLLFHPNKKPKLTRPKE